LPTGGEGTEQKVEKLLELNRQLKKKEHFFTGPAVEKIKEKELERGSSREKKEVRPRKF